VREYYPDFEAMAAYDAWWQRPERDLRPMVGVRLNIPLRTERRDAAVAEAHDRLDTHQQLTLRSSMDRNLVYPGSIPLDTDLLAINRNAMIGLGFLAQAALGSNTVVDGLACTPTAPPSLTVNVGPGSIAQLNVVDVSAFGSLPADSTDPLVKMGINLQSTPFTLVAPAVSGQSTNYLIEAAFIESDTAPTVLPYYNAANPAQPFSGPNNAGTAQNTQRIQRVQLQLKAGTPANTGSQTTPPVDSGWVGLYVVTVNFGQTAITAGSIAVLPTAPFVNWMLPALSPGFGAWRRSSRL